MNIDVVLFVVVTDFSGLGIIGLRPGANTTYG